MKFDDRPDFAKRLEIARRARLFDSAKAATDFHGWKYDTYVQHERGERGITRAAQKYARAYKVSAGWLLTGEGEGPVSDETFSAETMPEPESARPTGGFVVNPHEAPQRSDVLMPVYGLVIGGEDGRFFFNGETVGWVKTPEKLLGVKNAYALYVAGESMIPRFKPGEEVHVNPHKQPVRGDDVIIQLKPERDGEQPEGFIKEFRGWTPTKLLLWQWNPQQEVEFSRHLIKSVHVIISRG